MSFNRLLYDSCEQELDMNESKAPGLYQINTPVICNNTFDENPAIRMQKTGVSLNSGVDWRFYAGPVDVESDLRNINRPISDCPEVNYNPSCDDCNSTNGEPCGGGVKLGSSNNGKQRNWQRCGDSNLVNFPNSFFPTEDTRFSNSAKNLRGTGINRFNPLCLNPQEQIEFPGDYHVPTRLVIKDNHRPCVPEPFINSMIPPVSRQPCPETVKTCANFTGPLYQYDVCG